MFQTITRRSIKREENLSFVSWNKNSSPFNLITFFLNLGSKRTGMTYIKSASAEILLILAGERESIVKSFVILVKKKKKKEE